MCGIAGLNSGGITYCYAIVENVESGSFQNTTVYFGGLFGTVGSNATITNCFAKLDTDGLANNYDGGNSQTATMLRCYAYVTNKGEFAHNASMTVFDTEAELFATILRMDFDVMGFTVYDDAYPTLPTAGKTQPTD